MGTGQGARGLRPHPHSQWGGLSPVPRRDGVTPFPEAPPHFCRHCPVHTRGPRPSLGPLLGAEGPAVLAFVPLALCGVLCSGTCPVSSACLAAGLGLVPARNVCSSRTGSLAPWGWHILPGVTAAARRGRGRSSGRTCGGCGRRLQPPDARPQGCPCGRSFGRRWQLEA